MERVLSDHPAVRYACVYGVASDFLGEVVKAVLVLHESHTQDGATMRALREHCAARLADYKCPRSYEVLPLPQLPMTGSGKVAKGELRKGDAARKAAGRTDNALTVATPAEAPPLLAVEWRSAPLPAVGTARARLAADARVLLIGARATEGSELAAALATALGGSCAGIAADVSLPEPTAVEASGLEAAVSAATHALFLWPADESAKGTMTLRATEEVLARMLAASKAAIAAAGTTMWVITRGAAVRAPSPMATPNAAPMQACWGFARVIAAECADRSRVGGYVLDLCPCEPDAARDAAAIITEITTETSGDGAPALRGAEAAWRRRARFVPRLVAATAPAASGASGGKVVRPEASYLLTGGLGGLGLQWLPLLTSSEWGGATRLVLASRSGRPTEEAMPTLERARAAGAEIVCSRCDVAAEQEVAHILATDASSPSKPLAGIFHLAGLAGDGRIVDLRWADFLAQGTAKIHGSHHLHTQATAGKVALDHFVLFTSIYGLLGNPQLSHYAAANAYQDGLAHARLGEGLPALAVSWGTWAGAGMAHRFGAGFEKYWKGQGMDFIPLDAGLAALGLLMAPAAAGTADRLPHYAYMPARWAAYARARGPRLPQPLTAELVEASTVGDAVAVAAAATAPSGAAAGGTSGGAAARSEYGRLLAPVAARQRLAKLIDALRELLEEMMDADAEDEPVDFSLPVSEVGLTSMHVVDLVGRLAELTALELSPTLVYESVSLQALAETVLHMMELGVDDASGSDHEQRGGKAAAAEAAAADVTTRLVISGMGCRLPGGADTPEAFWTNLRGGVDAVGPPPTDRPHNGRPSGYLRKSTLMSFDALRFGINPTEAALMDPQQRLLLHAAHEAFVDAGVCVEELADRSVGVFVGISAVDYAGLVQTMVEQGRTDPSPYMGPAWSASIAANRISYLLNLTGPSIALDTACSSSLVAFTQAVTAIRAGHCSAALVAGVNVQLRRVWSDAFQRAGMLGDSQRCRFGADDADGYVRGEGVGCILISRLDDVPSALLGHVYAEVAAAAVNQDGLSNGLTAPNPAAQERLLRMAYKGLDVRKVAYVEAHGTGTPLGDPIELEALGRVLGRAGRAAAAGAADAAAAAMEPPVLVGSAKASIGHLECAAGMAAVIKASLVASKRLVPRTMHVTDDETKSARPNHLVNFGEIGLRLATKETALPDGEVLVGASGFGFGGTNAHVVLRTFAAAEELQLRGGAACDVAGAESCKLEPPPSPEASKRAMVLPLSAHSSEALAASAEAVARYLLTGGAAAKPAAQELPGKEQAATPLAEAGCWALCRAAVHTRAHSPRSQSFRLVVVGTSAEELAAKLLASVRGPTALARLPSKPPRVVVIFTGQGSEYIGMASRLHASSATFRQTFHAYSELLASMAEWHGPTAEALLYGVSKPTFVEETLTRPSFTQPVLVALALALYRVFTIDYHLAPTVTLGHSLGELSACAAGGLLSVRQALHIALLRGVAMQLLPKESGAMVAVRSASDLTTLHDLVELNSQRNSPTSSPPSSIVPSRRSLSQHSLHQEPTSPVSGPASPVSDLASAVPASFRASPPRLLPSHLSTPSKNRELSATDTDVPSYLSSSSSRSCSSPDESDASDDNSTHDVDCPDGAPPLKRLGQVVEALKDLPESLDAVKRVRSSNDLQALHDLGTAHPTLSFAAFNSRRSFVLSGDTSTIRKTTSRLKAAGFQATILNVNHGFHSADVEPALPTLLESVGRLLAEERTLTEAFGDGEGAAEPPTDDCTSFGLASLAPPRVISTHTGGPLDAQPTAWHWVQHARDPVQFEKAVGAAREHFGGTFFLEIGMQPHLTPHVLSADVKGKADAVSTLRKGSDDCMLLSEAVGALFAAGVDVDVGGLLPAGEVSRLPLAPLVGHAFWLPTDEAIIASATDPRTNPRALGSAGVMGAAPRTAGSPIVPSQPPPPPQLLHKPQWVRRPAAKLPANAAAVRRVCVIQAGMEPLPPMLRERLLAIGRLGRCPNGIGPRELVQLEGAISEAKAVGNPYELVVYRGDVVGLQALLIHLSESSTCEGLTVAVITQALLSNGSDDGAGNAQAKLSSARDAALWGFVKSARFEVPAKLNLIAFNADNLQSRATCTRLVGALLDGRERLPAGGCLAVSGDGLLEEKLMPIICETPRRSPALSTRMGTALITGGSGALALQLARWLLVSRGVAHVVLASRSGTVSLDNASLDLALQDAVKQTAGAAALTVERADACNRAAMMTLLSKHAAGLARGAIYHTAGVLDDGLLRSQTRERLETVMKPKTGASELLHTLLEELGIKTTMVLFSSVTSLAGNIGQTSYGAANAALDELALRRRASGQPAISVQWGPWAGGHGMAGNLSLNKSLWAPLEPSEALDSLGVAIDETIISGTVLYTIGALSPGAAAIVARKPCLQPLLSEATRAAQALPAPQGDGRAATVEDLVHKLGANPNHKLGAEELRTLTIALQARGGPLVEVKPPPTRRHLVTVTDVIELAKPFMNDPRVFALKNDSTVLDLDLDSLDLSAFANELSSKCGASVDVATLINATDLCDLAEWINAHGGGLLDDSPQPIDSAIATPRLGTAGLARRAVSTADVLSIAAPFMKGDASSLKPSSTVLDLDLDSLDLSAFANELSSKCGASVDVATLINVSDLDELARSINAQGGGIIVECSASSAVNPPPSLSKAVLPLAGAALPWASSHGEAWNAADGQPHKIAGTGGSDIEAGARRVTIDGELVEDEVTARRVAVRNAFEVKYGCLQPRACILVRTLFAILSCTIVAGIPLYLVLTLHGYYCSYFYLTSLASLHSISPLYPAVVAPLPIAAFAVGCVLAAATLVLSTLGWMLALKWTLCPRLVPGTKWEKWSLTWLRITLVQDFADPFHMMYIVLGLFSRTPILNAILRVLGARVAPNATIQAELCYFFRDNLPFLHLMDIEEDVLIEHQVILYMTTSDDEQELVFTCHELFLGRGCSLLSFSRVGAGARLEENVTVAPRSYAQGHVPANSAVISCDVIDEKKLKARPELHELLVVSLPRLPSHHTRPGWIVLYSGIAVGVFLMVAAIAATVGVSMVETISSLPPDLSSVTYTCSVLLIEALVFAHLVGGVLVIAAKWLVVGRVRPGSSQLTDSLIVRLWLFDLVFSFFDPNYGTLAVLRFGTVFTPLMNLYYMALGLRVPWSCILSPLPTALACRTLELLDISDGVYISGEVAFRPQGVTQSAGDVAAGGGLLFAKPITFKRDSFIGPNAVIQPGAIFETRAGSCESGVTAGGAIIKSGTATVGCGQRMPFRHERESVPAASPWTYHFATTILTLVYRLPLSISYHFGTVFVNGSLQLLLWVALALYYEHPMEDWEHLIPKAMLLSPAMAGVRLLYASYVGMVAQGVTSICANHVLMFGLLREDAKYPYFGWAHARWAICFASCRPMHTAAIIDPLWKYSSLSKIMYIMGGAKMGRFVDDFPGAFPTQPELQMIELGGYNSLPNNSTYAHSFGAGFMRFQAVRIGKAVVSKANLISPGVDVPNGTTIAPLTILSRVQTLTAPGQAVCGILPRVGERTSDGLYLTPGCGVRPCVRHDLRRGAYDDLDDIEVGGGKAAKLGVSMPRQVPTMDRRRRSMAMRVGASKLRRCLLLFALCVMAVPLSSYVALVVLPYMHDLLLFTSARTTTTVFHDALIQSGVEFVSDSPPRAEILEMLERPVPSDQPLTPLASLTAGAATAPSVAAMPHAEAPNDASLAETTPSSIPSSTRTAQTSIPFYSSTYWAPAVEGRARPKRAVQTPLLPTALPHY